MFLVRIYWGFVGNAYARWTNFIPYKREQVEEIGDIVKVDVLQTKVRGRHFHRPQLAGGIHLLPVVPGVSVPVGHRIRALLQHEPAWLPHMFAWIVPLMGGDFRVRQWHHAMMWFFILFAIVHVYLVFYHDYIEGRGTTSSMVGGWKFVRRSRND